MEWLFDPTIWVGLITLVVLEIVLGIDNLIFIAILADKLPPKQRDQARILGLSLALITRLVLLAGISWMVRLTSPWVEVGNLVLSGRDVILIVGGFFLLFKGTLELHERIEGKAHVSTGPRVYASFPVIVTQIVILDAVFSLDAIVTAVGVVNHLPVMMAAVIIAMIVMVLASKPLTRFVNAHQTVVVLCLAFLLMIGFSLVAEGFGFDVPKGYLYAAIGFSIFIEMLNQLARRNLLMLDSDRPMRERTAEAVLRMLGKRPPEEMMDEPDPAAEEMEEIAFAVEERNMVSGVLTLAERSVHSIMTPRTEITWLDLNDDPRSIRQQIESAPHSFFPVARGSLDDIIGVGRARAMIADLLTVGHIRESRLKEPIIIHDTISIIRLLDTLRHSRGQLVLVADEFGTIQGLVTPIDVFEAIAGEFPDEDETLDIEIIDDEHWLVDGGADLHQLEQVLHIDGLVHDADEYTTLAGFLLARFGQLPTVGARYDLNRPFATYIFTVTEMDGHRIAMVNVEKRTIEMEMMEGEKD